MKKFTKKTLAMLLAAGVMLVSTYVCALSDTTPADAQAAYNSISVTPVMNEQELAKIKARTTKSNGMPYYIMVNRSQNTVTVYALDDNGYYTKPVKAFIASTGREGHRTPLGTYKMGTNRYRWRLMVDGSHAQYACGIYKGYMFHSVCYKSPNPSTLMTEEYDSLGNYASLGCVRLQTRDAKWIYDNAKAGTLVTIYDSDIPGELGKPNRDINNLATSVVPNWDPTDPEPTNPWWTYWNAVAEVQAKIAAQNAQ